MRVVQQPPQHTEVTTTTITTTRQSHHNTHLILALLGVVLLALLSMIIGVYDITEQENGWKMLFITRLPRTFALMLTGSAMSLAGLVMQLITQNKMVEPTTTGTIEWAGLGLLVVYLVFPAPSLLQRMTGAILFALGGTLLFYMILRQIKFTSPLIVPIVGMMLGAIISSIATFFGLVFQMTQNIETWFVGSFANVQIGRYEYLWFMVIITIVIYYMADQLTVVGLGEDMATNLGIRYNTIVLIATILIAMTVGIVTSVIGNLPFLGLIVPNIVSMLRGDHLRHNLPWVCLVGMSIVIVCDILSRTINMPFEVPVSMLLGTLGAFVFVIILLKERRRQ